MARLVHTHIDLGKIAQHLEEAKTQGANGGVSFDAFAADDAIAVLISCVEFSGKVPDRERQRIVHSAVFEAGRRGVITKQSLEREIGHLERSYLSQPPQPYVLATTISVGTWRWELPRTVKLDGTTITFAPQRPKHFNRDPVVEEFPREFRDADPKDFASVRIRVSARSANEAVETAFDTLDFLRGIWNYILNRPTLGRFFTGRPQPINSVRLGPIHTLHHPNGTVVKHIYWYDPFYMAAEPERISDQQSAVLQRDTAAIRRLLAQLPYGQTMRDVFIRYARALDTADFDKAFLKLWQLLELLTDTSAGEGYEKTIRRALFIWKEVDRDRAVLEHLRTYRNASVHSGFSTDQTEKYTFQLKRYVEELIVFHLTAKPSFKTLHDIGQYFDLPRDPDTLRNKIDLFERALRFRRGKPRKK